MDMLNLKSTLINSNIFIDNEYIDKYVKLIMENISTKPEKHKTELHHIFPRCFHTSYNDSVNLYYKDHVLAHYLIYNCVKDRYKYASYLPLRFMLSKQRADKYSIDADYLNDLQENYENSKYRCGFQVRVYNPITDIEKKIYISDAEEYVNGGYILGGRPHTEELRNFIIDNIELHLRTIKDYRQELNYRKSYAFTGIRKKNTYTKQSLERLKQSSHNLHYKSIYVHKGDIVVNIPNDKIDEELQKFIDDGYELGNPNAASIKNKVFVSNGEKEIAVPVEELKSYMESGWVRSSRKPMGGKTHSEYTKKLQSEKAKGRHKGKIHITNGIINKFLLPEEAEIYLQNGFHRGRVINKNNK